MKFPQSPKIIFFAPPLFAVAFVFSVYLANIREVTPDYIVEPLLAAVLFSVVLAAILNKFFGLQKGVLLAAFSVILFFSYRDLFLLTDKLHIASFLKPAENDFVIFIAWFAFMEIAFLTVKNTSKNLAPANGFLLIVSILAVVIPAAAIVRHEINRPYESGLGDENIPQAKSMPPYLPDIYYIVPDSYSAPWVMKEYFSCDLDDFTTSMERKGFYIPQAYTSNYSKTFLSLASTMNMEYLDSLSRYKNSPDQSLTKPMIDNSEVMRFVKSLGYRYYQVGSWYNVTNYNSYADGSYSYADTLTFDIGEFGSAVLAATMAKPIKNIILSASPNLSTLDERRDYTEYEFEKLAEISKKTAPKFVFAHMLVPHTPYVYDANCAKVDYRYFIENDENTAYCNQAKCVNKKINEVIDKILSNYDSEHQPVIVIQSDEGSTFLRYRIDAKDCRGEDCWGKASDSLLQQKFPVLAAYRLPGLAESNFYPSMSGVNSFRLIFNEYFGTDLPLLPDKNYIFPDDNHCYDFREVTETVRAGFPAMSENR